MPLHLKRYQQEGDDHFVTFSCFDRLPYLKAPDARTLFVETLEAVGKRYELQVLGYVVMPEHVHLLLSEPHAELLSKALGALKLSVSKRSSQRPFWTPRYYDFNVFTYAKRVEKLEYMHHNPVARGLVGRPEDWPWSSYRFYQLGEASPVSITKPW